MIDFYNEMFNEEPLFEKKVEQIKIKLEETPPQQIKTKKYNPAVLVKKTSNDELNKIIGDIKL